MSHPRVLIINDYTPLRDLLRINLKVRGYAVVDTNSSRDLIEVLRKEQPDLVILDLVLDEVDGFEICRRICQEGSAAVIVLNLRSGESDMLKCLEMGIADYISKPFGVDELMARIEASLRYRQKARVVEPVLQK
jgi:DNA-binding response OmpR family regulator